MEACRIAVLGGDRREAHIAELLRAEGHEVARFPGDGEATSYRVASSPADAVDGVQWIVCPSPGLGPGDVVYAPGCEVDIVLDRTLLERADAANGGLVLGASTPTLQIVTDALGIAVHEMKGERALAISNGTSVAEAVVALLVGMTDRLLREHRVVVIGYGATGAPITDYLLAACCHVVVACRSSAQRARAEQRGAATVAYEDRVGAILDADIVVNTVPDVEAVPSSCFGDLDRVRIVDIASPPGGLDHDAAPAAGVDVTWARGLAGKRAPLSVGETQFEFVKAAMVARNGGR